jgi:hypothetical protein
MEFSRKIINVMLVVWVVLSSLLVTGCTASKESTIRCTKCGASPADLQRQYEQGTKSR